jgi:TolB-like protein
MASLIPGYEYDIFISYRHKDNKYDGWVTEFVTYFKKELESTFKEKVSIYFDEDQQDGLHETDDVDDSLREKIKCLVFIPIVSRTFCDPASFAWKNELLSFLDFAKRDPFGLKIKVPNGNVSSRILPVRTHDLDCDDVELFEHTVGGSMRPIDFVFNSAGVNRPLRAHEDDPRENQNHRCYRDQINKLANAVRVIITSMRCPRQKQEKAVVSFETPVYSNKTMAGGKLRNVASVILLICCLCYAMLTVEKNKVSVNVDNGRTVAVLPFTDMSESRDQEHFGDGMSEELLNRLAKIPAVKVISRTSAFCFKGTKEDIRTIGDKLGVTYVLEGSVRKSENVIRINAQLSRTSDGTQVWSETFDRDTKEILKVQSEIANAVVKELEIKVLGHVLLTEKR